MSHDQAMSHDPSKQTYINSGAGLSRRQFLSLSAVAGAFTILGVTTVGNTTTIAYADETGEEHFTVYVLSVEEVPIVAVELTADGKQKAVQGMVVQLSNDQGTFTTNPTDDKGFTAAKIKNLCDDKSDDLSSYSCYAQVKATASGFRTFEEHQMFLSGIHADDQGVMHNTVRIPTQIDDGKTPYLSEMSLDGQDLQFTTRDVYVHPNNNLEHVVTLTLRNAGSSPWTFSFEADGKTILLRENVVPTDGVATVDLKGDVLKQGGGISVGSKLTASFVPTAGGTKTTVTSSATVKQGDMLLPEGYDKNYEISVGGTACKHGEAGSTQTVPIEGWMKRQRFNWNVKCPFLPIEVFCDLDDNIGASANLSGFYLFKIRNGKNELKSFADRWKPVSPKSCASSFAQQTVADWERWMKCIDNGFRSEGILAHTPMSTLFDFAIDLQLRGYGKRVKKTAEGSHSDMTLGLIAQAEAKFEATMPFTAVFIPMFWSFDIAGIFLVKYQGHCEFDDIFQNTQWYADDKNPSFLMNLDVETGLSIGAGGKGILSMYIRGYGYLRNTLKIGVKSQKTQVVGTIGAGVKATVQALMFNKNFKLAETKPKVIYVEPKEMTAEIEAEYASYTSVFANEANGALLDLSGQEYPCLESGDMEIFTEDELHVAAEFALYMNETGEEGCVVQGEWVSGAMMMRNGFERFEIPDETAGIIDPYNPPEGGAHKPYNPIRGVVPSSEDLIKTTIFSDPRYSFVDCSCCNPEAHVFTFMYRVGVVLLNLPSSQDNGGYSVINVTKDGKTFPYVMSPAAVRSSDEEAAKIVSGEGTVDSNASYVYRSRIVWSYATTEGPWCFESALNLNGIPDRANTWDVDFDVIAFNTNRYVMACTTRRPFMEELDFETVFNTQFLTLVELPNGSESSAKYYHFQDNDTMVRWSPRLHAALKNVTDADEKSYEVACYYYQRGKSQPNSATVIGKAVLDIANGTPTWTPGQTVAVPSAIQGIVFEGELTVGGIRSDKKISGHPANWPAEGQPQVRLFAWCCGETEEHSAMSVFWIEGKPEQCAIIKNACSCTMLPATYRNNAIRFILARSCTTGNSKQVLSVEIDTSQTSPTIQVKPVMNNSHITTFFASNGNTARNSMSLIAVRAMEGAVPALPQFAQDAVAAGAQVSASTSGFSSPYATLDEDGYEEGGLLSQYQLLRADWIYDAGQFCDFYPVAQFDSSPDYIRELDFYYSPATASGSGTYIYATHNELLGCGASLYFAKVPIVAGIQLEGIEPLSQFCMAGDVCPLLVTVSNTGNDRLSGFTVVIEGGGKKTSMAVTNLGECVQGSINNYVEVLDNEGEPTGERVYREESASMKKTLFPGQTRTYRVNTRLPEGVQGQIDFKVTVEKPEIYTIAADERAAMAQMFGDVDDKPQSGFTLRSTQGGGEDNGNIVYMVDPRPRTMSFDSATGMISTGDLHVSWSSDQGGPAPKTGDRTSLGVALATAGAAAVTAGVAAYERRRAENATEE